MAKRGNPFTGDGRLGRTAWNSKGGSNSAVKVTAHERKRPVRAHIGPKTVAQNVQERLVDSMFGGEVSGDPTGAQNVSGLQRPGEKQVNHLAGAIGLLNRKRV